MDEASTSNLWATDDGDDSTLSIVDMIARTASKVTEEQALPGYIFYEEYGMYYNHESGYYYDPKTSLFYHTQSQQYYRYDNKTHSYLPCGDDGAEPTSMASVPTMSWTQRRFKRRANKLFGAASCSSFTADDIDVAEVLFEMTEMCLVSANKRSALSALGEDAVFMEEVLSRDSRADIERSGSVDDQQSDDYNYDDDVDEDENYAEMLRRRHLEAESAAEAPCIRLMTFVDDGSPPTLHIVTIVGATIGCGVDADVRLIGGSSVKLAAPLLNIRYRQVDGNHVYEASLADGTIGSSAVRIIMNEANVLIKGDCFRLSHNDILRIELAGDSGSEATQFGLLIHLHNGLNTCAGCEPGLYAASPTINNNNGEPSGNETNASRRRRREAERLRVVRQIKRDYGLDDPSDQVAVSVTKRRYEPWRNPQNVGIYAKCLAAPKPGQFVDTVVLQKSLKRGDLNATLAAANKTPIESQNRGFQLLKSMGWNEGKGLGKNQQGLAAPVELVSKTRFEEESTSQSILPLDSATGRPSMDVKRKAVFEITKARYEKAAAGDK